MNQNARRESYRRDLTHRMSYLRQQAGEQTVQREASIRSRGIAHPRSIEVSRRLNETMDSWRHLRRLHQASASQDGSRSVPPTWN